ncbi:MAG TPA: hypothetical protein VMU24_11880 [Candidatus Acidoferrales bacterium]|nr:hypothetical protein [Candidatus Acidoferrales bacterium]
MNRLARALLLVALACPLSAYAQQHPEPQSTRVTTDARPEVAPPPEQIITRVRDNQKQIDLRRKDYICNFEEETQKLDHDGDAKKTERKGYEMFFVSGVPIVRQLSKEGKPLSDDEARKEQERVDKEIKKARERAEKRERNPDDPNELGIKQFLEAARFTNGRYEDYRGKRVLAYDFEPNPDFKPHTRAETLANRLNGTVWIDAQALQVVRLETRMTGDLKIGGGLIANIRKGSALILEQEFVNGEVWLPSMVDASLGARILLLKSAHERIIDRFSDYRKFRVESKITLADPSQKQQPEQSSPQANR